jgi:hypothetical protein
LQWIERGYVPGNDCINQLVKLRYELLASVGGFASLARNLDI